MDESNTPADTLATAEGADSADQAQEYVTLADENENAEVAGQDDGDDGNDGDAGRGDGTGEEEGEGASQAQRGDDGKPKRRPGSAKWRERARHAERELAQLRAEQRREDHAVGDGDDLKEPQEKDFPNWLAYQRALNQYDSRKVIREERQREREAADRARTQREHNERVAAYRDNLSSVRDRIPDYDRVMAEVHRIEIRDDVRDQILKNPKGPLVAYYLARNLGKVAELNRMSPIDAAAEIGSLAARIRTPKANIATAARAVRTPPRGGSAPPNRDPSAMSMEDFVKWREKS